jgi:hypothetical protein
MRKLQDDTCTPGEMNQKFFCEDGAIMMAQYQGSDTMCTGDALMTVSVNAITQFGLCNPVDSGPEDFSLPYFSSMGCIGDTPSMIFYNSTDCSDACVMATSASAMGLSTECAPSTCSDESEDDVQDDGTPACLTSCPQPQDDSDICGHVASVLAGDSASCIDGCAGSESEYAANLLFLGCGLPTVGDTCGAAPAPPPSAAGRVAAGALGLVAAALGAVLM